MCFYSILVIELQKNYKYYKNAKVYYYFFLLRCNGGDRTSSFELFGLSNDGCSIKSIAIKKLSIGLDAFPLVGCFGFCRYSQNVFSHNFLDSNPCFSSKVIFYAIGVSFFKAAEHLRQTKWPNPTQDTMSFSTSSGMICFGPGFLMVIVPVFFRMATYLKSEVSETFELRATCATFSPRSTRSTASWISWREGAISNMRGGII